MPHLKIEISENLGEKAEASILATTLHEAAGTCPGIDLNRIKTRITHHQSVLIGSNSSSQKMIHAEFAILSGRDLETKKKYAAILSESIRTFCEENKLKDVSITVEIRDMDRDTYFRN